MPSDAHKLTRYCLEAFAELLKKHDCIGQELDLLIFDEREPRFGMRRTLLLG